MPLPPMTPFKMKLMIHCASPARKWPFSATLAPTRTSGGNASRNATIERYAQELYTEGLIGYVTFDGGMMRPSATPKGEAFIAAVLSTPMPVQAKPEWTMPGA